MKLYTVHAEAPPPPGPEGWPEPKARPPVLVKEGFSLAAAIFGPLWFAWNRLWWEALGLFLLIAAASLLLPEALAGVVVPALHVLAGFEARDRLRARLARRGQKLAGVVAAPDLEIAWFRLMQQRPDLVRSAP
ncbi:DUF2628 domain-containing protein [Falsiroseomonas tokyonensis]|uniref:DUF2628 domain-containing protein n=1 Tax=Falsiroseomonas tokyonensis TaxID=430521 RepID=A0ABV7BQT3_9PROT|nr:DUF2628 domain-containing protein [Falsiroseomonas tokyonensis]MBU8537022.1 DUF2628 domain-containing protein [Falsiroseomonas tokyonensis]